MQGDYSLSLAGSASDVEAVKSSFQTFIANLKAAGVTVTSGAFTASQQVDLLEDPAAAGADPAAPGGPTA